MPYYSVPGFNTSLSTTFVTCTVIFNSGTAVRRGRLYEAFFGASSAPNATDCNIQIDVGRTNTTFGGGINVVPNQIDPADVPAVNSANVAFTSTNSAGFTTNTGYLSESFNQRSIYSWKALQESMYFTWAAVANSGIGARALSPTYNSGLIATLSWLE
jgi:hypothetical protein